MKVGIRLLGVDNEVPQMDLHHSNVLEIWGDSKKEAVNRNWLCDDDYYSNYFVAFIEFSFFECIDVDSGI